jgi:hypothetical protein
MLMVWKIFGKTETGRGLGGIRSVLEQGNIEGEFFRSRHETLRVGIRR